MDERIYLDQRLGGDEAQSTASALTTTLMASAGRLILHLAFAVALLWFHFEFSEDIYGFVLDANVNRTFSEVALGLGLALFPTFLIPQRLELPSQVFAYIVYLSVYLPFCTVGLQCIALPIETLLPFIILCGLALIGFFTLARVPPRPIARRGLSIAIVSSGLVLASVTIIALQAATIGINWTPLALEDVYDLRLDLREQFAAGGFLLLILNYLLAPLTNVLSPAIVYFGIVRRRLSLLVIGLAITFATYQATGAKGALGASAVVVLAAFVWGSTRAGRFGVSSWRVAAVLLCFVFLAPFLDFVRDDQSQWLTNLMVSRQFIIPPMLTGFWVEFFSQNPHGYYAGAGALGLIFGREEIYGMALPRVIGLFYVGSEQANANVNLFAEGYGQAGLIGVIIASIVAAAALRLLDRVAVDRDANLILPICFPLAYCLVDGHIFGLILTNGLWMLIVLIYFLPKHEIQPP